MANAQFNYGFEYLGVQDKLVQTPLTDRLYLTMTQALEERLGGSPFGQCIAVPPALCNFVLRCVQMLKRTGELLYGLCLVFYTLRVSHKYILKYSGVLTGCI